MDSYRWTESGWTLTLKREGAKHLLTGVHIGTAFDREYEGGHVATVFREILRLAERVRGLEADNAALSHALPDAALADRVKALEGQIRHVRRAHEIEDDPKVGHIIIPHYKDTPDGRIAALEEENRRLKTDIADEFQRRGDAENRLTQENLRLAARLDLITREREHFFKENIRLRTELAEAKERIESRTQGMESLNSIWVRLADENDALRADLAAAIRTGEKQAEKIAYLGALVVKEQGASVGFRERLRRLDTLLASEEVPEGLRMAICGAEPPCGGGMHSGQSTRAWRWFREQFGVEVPRETAESAPLAGQVAETPVNRVFASYATLHHWRPSWEEEGRKGPKDAMEADENYRAMLTSRKADAELGRSLVAILSKQCGERGDNEGAVQTLERIIRERECRVEECETLTDSLKLMEKTNSDLHRENVALLEILRDINLSGYPCPLCRQRGVHAAGCRLWTALDGKAAKLEFREKNSDG